MGSQEAWRPEQQGDELSPAWAGWATWAALGVTLGIPRMDVINPMCNDQIFANTPGRKLRIRASAGAVLKDGDADWGTGRRVDLFGLEARMGSSTLFIVSELA